MHSTVATALILHVFPDQSPLDYVKLVLCCIFPLTESEETVRANVRPEECY